MPTRLLFILSANPEVIDACTNAGNLAKDAVGEISVCNNLSDINDGSFDGLVVVDPELMAPLSVHEFALDFLRHHRALLFLLTTGNVKDSDGLARFVGAQAAISMPIDAADLANHLSSPFGVPTTMRPAPLPAPDTAALSDSIEDILPGQFHLSTSNRM